MSHNNTRNSNSDEEDEAFFRAHAREIAQLLQQQDDLGDSNSNANQDITQREQLIHDTYIQLCHDDPLVSSSDLACHYVAAELLSVSSQYGLCGPLVEGVRQLCQKYSGSNTTMSPGVAVLAWTLYARIPLLCCQAATAKEAAQYLGSYRPPAPTILGDENEMSVNKNDNINHTDSENSKQQQADQLVEALAQSTLENDDEFDNNIAANNNSNSNDLDEVWAAESDPSDFDFGESGTYEENYAMWDEWLVDRTNPQKLSEIPTHTLWHDIRNAVLQLLSQLNYRSVEPIFTETSSQSQQQQSRTPHDILKQLTLTLLIPPTNLQNTIFAPSDDNENDNKEILQYLQSMAWQPLGVLREAASLSLPNFTTYLSLLQTLLSVDAAANRNSTNKTPANTTTLSPATHVGLASLSAMCQQFVQHGDFVVTKKSPIVTPAQTKAKQERFRALRLSVLEAMDDVAHALEQEQKQQQNADNNNTNDWILWTLLPLLEIIAIQRLQNGQTICAKFESTAQRHFTAAASQQWSAAFLQSGFLRLWLLSLQALQQQRHQNASTSTNLLWTWMRRALLYGLSQSMPATTALSKYAWRFPQLATLLELGDSFAMAKALAKRGKIDSVHQTELQVCANESDDVVDHVLWHLLALQLAGDAVAAPTIQWKSKSHTNAVISLPSKEESQQLAVAGFVALCQAVTQVLQAACNEENKKENNYTIGKGVADDEGSPNGSKGGSAGNATSATTTKESYQLVLKQFHRLVQTLADCPTLAQIFVQELEPIQTDDEASAICKCLDTMQEALSQYKAPPPPQPVKKSSVEQENDEDHPDQPPSRKTKDASSLSSLQEDIHTTRKMLKVLRSLLQTRSALVTNMMTDALTSASKTD